MLDKSRHKTAVILGTLSPVPNYPKKLKVYLNNASPYWQAVYWDRGKTHRRSLKTSDKRTAYEHAKAFYEQVIVAKYSHPNHLAHYQIKTKEEFIAGPDLSFKKIAAEWLSRRASKWTANHTKQVELRLVNNIFKFIADKNIQRITRKDLLDLLQRMEARGAYGLARRVLNDCKQIWQYALVIEVCKQDITLGLNKALHAHTVVHFNAVTPQELPELMCNIANYNKADDLIVKYALQLMALTFVRKNELIQATWDEFDLENALWKIPAARMKMRLDHVVPLSKQTLSLLYHIKSDRKSVV
jgi:integrase